MKILLLSIGSRGDIEPFLALAHAYAQAGHEIVCAFPEQFRDLVEPLDYTFYGFDRRFLELIEGQHGKEIMGGDGGWWAKLSSLYRMGKIGMRIQRGMVRDQFEILTTEQPELVYYHPKVSMPVIWDLASRARCILVCPVPAVIHPLREVSTIGVWGNRDLGKFGNAWSYRLVNAIRSKMVHSFTKPFYREFPDLRVRPASIYRHTLDRAETFYTISPTLFPQPDYWPASARVVGYRERPKTLHWKPDTALLRFLDRFDRIAFFTFGSMSNARPTDKTRAILDVVTPHRIPTIINVGWGGLQRVQEAPDYVLFVNDIPYDYIFPKIHTVIHHGGSGTTHTAAKNGCVQFIIPHIVDQFFWNRHLATLGVGPLGVKIQHFTKETLEPRLLAALNNQQYHRRAQQIAAQMAAEQHAPLPYLE